MLLPKPTGWAAPGTVEFLYGSYRHRIPDLQPWLAARPDRPQPARYRFLQALDAADDPGILPGPARHLFGHQPEQAGSPRRSDRRKRASRPTRSCPLDPLFQKRIDMAPPPPHLSAETT